MMASDFDTLRAAWTSDQPSMAEVANSRRLWKRAVWRSRAWNLTEGAALLALAAYLANWIVGNVTWQSAVLSGIIVAGLWWSQFKRYRLRSAEIGALDAERIGFLHAEVRRLKARRLRNALAIALIVPLFALGIVVGRMQDPAALEAAKDLGPASDWLQSSIGKVAAIILLALVLYKLATALRRDQASLTRSDELIEEYRAEQRRDAKAADQPISPL